MLHETYKTPVLIVLGFFGIPENEDRSMNVYYRGTFEMSSEEIKAFKKKTLKLAEFNNSLGDEDYQLFLYADTDYLNRYRDVYMNLR